MYRDRASDDPPQAARVRVRVEGLWAAYADTVALSGVSFDLEEGRIYGLVGPNGAGKSTLMRCLGGLLRPLKGAITFEGAPLAGRPSAIALMPDRPPVWEKLTAREQLLYGARIDGVAPAEIPGRVDAWIARVGLAGREHHPVRALSLGQRQRLGLAQAMLREAAFVMLDEPANGMDPDARGTLAEVLREVAARGTTVLVSSHVLSELDALCDAFVVLAGGRVTGVGTAHELHGADRGTLVITVSLHDPAPGWEGCAASAVASLDGAQVSGVDGNRLRVQVSESPATHVALLRTLLAAGLPVSAFVAERPKIAALYTQLSRRHGDPA